jgi:hypothetical protein
MRVQILKKLSLILYSTKRLIFYPAKNLTEDCDYPLYSAGHGWFSKYT